MVQPSSSVDETTQEIRKLHKAFTDQIRLSISTLERAWQLVCKYIIVRRLEKHTATGRLEVLTY